MKITRISPFSKKENTMEINVSEDQLQRWYGGELIQNVMPLLTPDEREFIMTGITPKEWSDTFGGEE